ncbi:Zinc finger C2H2-type [Dillenia turbinata]|uniref:Zinc finger C2H2-type n=1 Tax=Dillenia turbinata TaxID=194707 RepID=A0AAN8ZK14_9MAGN
MEQGRREGPIFRDRRRYFCQYCGICRSKKSLISSHILSHHSEEEKMKGQSVDDDNGEKKKLNVCEECGASFCKPAHLKQHMQSHCLERQFTCPLEDCNSSYRRKDHLNRHLLRHQGKTFVCPVQQCNSEFAFQGNMTRHIKEFHGEDSSFTPDDGPKQYVCPEAGCGKVFKFASKLQKHKDSHVKLDSVEAICLEPGCMKVFTNDQCLKAHVQTCHQHITCHICGTKQLKKNIKRHLRTHETKQLVDGVKCIVAGCNREYSTMSNLQQHVKVAHLNLRPFSCRIPGCDMSFSFKHVRDNHEKTGRHVHTQGDFEEADQLFRSRSRGGRKRRALSIESLMRKRVTLPDMSGSALGCAPEYLSWLLSVDSEEQQERVTSGT